VQLMFSGREAVTDLGRDMIAVVLKQVDLLQRAMLIVQEGAKTPREPPSDDERSGPVP
jgi:hypothetical protein